jgi:hypothetical protein
MRERFPLHHTVLPGTVYEILDIDGHRVAEISASTARAAIEEAKANWPESRAAIKRNELHLKTPGARSS